MHARGIINNVQRKVNTDAKHYRKAHHVVEVVSIVIGDQTWQRKLHQLDDRDIRALSTAAVKIKEFKKHCMSNGAKHGHGPIDGLKSWLGLIGRKPASSDEYREGMAVYAFCQAELHTLMGKFCENSWR
ncbi:uncharacterized protein LAESUDRAFT_755823 [Laetiporus sulphureus 93-53]|uniref:Uncharacterized protein n=1 Tax=Laetiporus sulphureus 93-53 TaxID=1314785 RepID=A0A165GGL7_9APHY|nr:uncharacterized protein LAESUDRAFT_755823 [Laetiporus sulphureus 93-53]KZT10316.1 hypothetical protein LAESUDRAFT_755823 [Laetiporus sulphureus 93-53]